MGRLIERSSRIHDSESQKVATTAALDRNKVFRRGYLNWGRSSALNHRNEEKKNGEVSNYLRSWKKVAENESAKRKRFKIQKWEKILMVKIWGILT